MCFSPQDFPRSWHSSPLICQYLLLIHMSTSIWPVCQRSSSCVIALGQVTVIWGKISSSIEFLHERAWRKSLMGRRKTIVDKMLLWRTPNFTSMKKVTFGAPYRHKLLFSAYRSRDETVAYRIIHRRLCNSESWWSVPSSSWMRDLPLPSRENSDAIYDCINVCCRFCLN